MDNLQKIRIAKFKNVKLQDRRDKTIHEEDQYFLVEDNYDPKSKMNIENNKLGFDFCGYFDVDVKDMFLDLKAIYENIPE